MIANRFRAVGWVASVAAAALSCYLVSLQVAAERGQLMKMERRILSARADVRQLQTELNTRGRLVQLERWNTDVLGLQAPKVSQYAAGETQLAAYLQPRRGMSAPVVLASATAPAPALPPAPAVVAVAYRAPPAAARQPRPEPQSQPAPEPIMVHHATYAPPPARPVIERVALDARPVAERIALIVPRAVRPATLLADDLMRDIGRAAAVEARGGKKR